MMPTAIAVRHRSEKPAEGNTMAHVAATGLGRWTMTCAALTAAMLSAGTAHARPAAAAPPKVDVPALQRGLAAREYHASRSAGGLQATNRAQDLRTFFEPTGVRIADRRVADATLAGLRLRGIGREAGPMSPPPAPG